MSKDKKIPWYVAGLHFECTECGGCCSGPEEGFIWITKQEIEFLAKHLEITVDELHKRYLRKHGLRTTIIEHPVTKDCIFLDTKGGKKLCKIYPVRPNQCRTWPFWASNLGSSDDWNEIGQHCPGINRGRGYTMEEIEQRKKQRRWWDDEESK